MKIVFFTNAIKYPLTGIGRYALELINQLKKAPEIVQLLYFCKLHISDRLPKCYCVQSFPNKILPRWFKRRTLLVETFRIIYSHFQKRALKQYKDYLYHSPNYYLPIGLSRTITTFHDISVFTTPKFHPPERVHYLTQEMKASLIRAQRIITVSSFSKQELAKYFNYPLTKIDVTYLACNETFYPREASVVMPLMQKFGLNAQGYSLFTGTIEPRKNLITLLNAYEQLPQCLRQRYPLVLSGYEGWCSSNEYQRFERGSREGWIKYLGYIAQEELPILFAAARLFVFPSLYEGFGLPILEAMASGIPVVCSNIAPFLEVAGDAAFFCEPQDVDTLREHIIQGLQDETWRTRMRLAGLINARKFSWKRCAQDTIKAYYKV